MPTVSVFRTKCVTTTFYIFCGDVEGVEIFGRKYVFEHGYEVLVEGKGNDESGAMAACDWLQDQGVSVDLTFKWDGA